MKSRLLLSALIGAAFLAASPHSQAANMPLPRSAPEAQGLSSQAICDFVDAADKIDTLHSFMIVRHGQVIAEGWWKPESADKPHVLASLSKSFNSTAIGLAIEEGKLAVDSWATVGSLSGVANGLIDQAHAYRRLSDPVSALAHYGAVTALLRRSAGSQQLLQHRVAEAHQRELKDALSEREVANAMAQSTRLGEALTGRLSRALTLVIA